MVVAVDSIFRFHYHGTAESFCLVEVLASGGLCHFTGTIEILRRMRIVFIRRVFIRTSALEDISEELGDCRQISQLTLAGGDCGKPLSVCTFFSDAFCS